jgi:NAD(P)-dependent dehydrogenase (short-subunit alcohol dehydrogenase family)
MPPTDDGQRSALVTGAAGGIGSCIARRLAARGDHVIAVDLDSRGLRDLGDSIAARGGSLQVHVLDLAECGEDALADILEAAPVPLSVAVLCAGMTRELTVLGTSVDDFTRLVAANLRATFLALTVAGRLLRERRTGGSIVTIGSINAIRPLQDQAVYSATKAAIASLTTSAALELAPHGIRVIGIAPGAVATPMNPGIDAQTDMSGVIPIPRVGTPDDIADAVEFLVSERASYITASSLVVDGGLIERR